MSKSEQKFAIICNPKNRRCQFFIDAVLSQGFETPVVISYLDLLQGKVELKSILQDVDILKIESYGEDFEVRKYLLAKASSLQQDFISKEDAMHLAFDKGRIQFLKQQYVGFELLLNDIQKVQSQLPNLQVMNPIEDILLQFDKTKCHQLFKKNGISVIPAIYNVNSFDDLMVQMKSKAWTRVFVKANYGSSASGVLAFRTNGAKVQAITSVEFIDNKGDIKLYNSLKIRTYNDIDRIKKMINLLAKDGLLVEKWIPKTSTSGGVYDFRMLVINGKLKHTIARQSQSPLTNLHLGNKRGDLEAIKEEIGLEKWQNMVLLAEKTARVLPNSLYSGLDILLSKSKKTSYLIEANSFGDLLPNLWIDGLDTYETQVAHYKVNQNA